MKRLLLIGLCFLLVATVACSSSPEVSTSASQLYELYCANEVTADLCYKGRIVRVYGEIGLIGRTDSGKAYIILRGGDWTSYGVQCNFSKTYESQLWGEFKGGHVSVIGKCKGLARGLFGPEHVVLDNCKLVRIR